MVQNHLDGKHGTPKTKLLTNGTRKLHVEIDHILAIQIRKLGKKGALRCYIVTVHVSKGNNKSNL